MKNNFMLNKGMIFKDTIKIENKKIGKNYPCLVIAEAGISHFGDIKIARDLVDMAVDSGADVFKTQIFDVDNLISKNANDWKERLRPRNLNFDQIQEIKERCKKKGIIFLTTAHDESRIEWLKKLDVSSIKIGSGEKNNLDFISKLARLGKPIIVSTGMCNNEDVKKILSVCLDSQCNNVCLLHCVTSYPVPINQINLAAMDQMKSYFNGPVGYSDHSKDGNAVLAAVARGANIVERHITIFKNIPNAQDWKVASDPKDFPKLIKNIRQFEKMIGNKEKNIAPCEEKGTQWALKSLVASKLLDKGKIITREDIEIKRPGTGMPPSSQKNVIGKRLKYSMEEGDFFNFDNLI